MRITDHLQLSVLTAPVASYDRRVLSQAWYSALYGTPSAQHAPAQPRTQLESRQRRIVPRQAKFAGEQERAIPARRTVALPRTNASRTPAPLEERRGVRSLLAKRIATALLRRNPAKAVTLSIGNGCGRVRIFLQAGSCGTRLVALCAPADVAEVRAALVQARYALAGRGIDLQFALRERTDDDR